MKIAFIVLASAGGLYLLSRFALGLIATYPLAKAEHKLMMKWMRDEGPFPDDQLLHDIHPDLFPDPHPKDRPPSC